MMSEKEGLEFLPISMPQSLKKHHIIGLCRIYQINSKVLRALPDNQVMRLSTKYNILSNQLDIENYDDELKLEFQITQKFQARLYGAIKRFYNDCLSSQDRPQFGGLIIYGDPGTGKTHLSEKIIDRLKENGLSIWTEHLR